MDKNSTTPRQDKVSPLYRVGDTIIFNLEGNIRACVTGYEVIDGKVWLAAGASCLQFVVPFAQVIGVEPKEERK